MTPDEEEIKAFMDAAGHIAEKIEEHGLNIFQGYAVILYLKEGTERMATPEDRMILQQMEEGSKALPPSKPKLTLV